MEPVQAGSARPNENSAADPALALADIADRVSKRMATAVMIAGAVVGLAVYWKPAPTRFEAFVAGGELFRVNTKTGTVIACNPNRCMTVVRRGQRLMSYKNGRLFQTQPAAVPPSQEPRRLPPSS